MCISLKLITYSSGQSVLWNQRAIAYPLHSSIQNSCHALIRDLVLKQAICAYHIPWILALGANDPVVGTPFDKAGCLQ